MRIHHSVGSGARFTISGITCIFSAYSSLIYCLYLLRFSATNHHLSCCHRNFYKFTTLMSNFEEVGAKRKSEVWQHFLFCKSTEKAKCKLCQTIFKASGSSTKGLISHLKSKHKIEVKYCLDVEDRPKPQIRKIDSFFK